MEIVDRFLDKLDHYALAVSSAMPWASREPYSDYGKSEPEENSDGSVTINGRVVPKLVAEQLKKLGVSLAFYNDGQIQAAVNACAVDCNLIDDPNGNNFFDDLERDADDDAQERKEEQQEKEEQEELEEELYSRKKIPFGHGSVFAEPSEAMGSVFFDPSFRDKIKAERDQQRKRRSASKGDESSESAPLQMGV